MFFLLLGNDLLILASWRSYQLPFLLLLLGHIINLLVNKGVYVVYVFVVFWHLTTAPFFLRRVHNELSLSFVKTAQTI